MSRTYTRKDWLRCWYCGGGGFEKPSGPSRLCGKCGGDGCIHRSQVEAKLKEHPVPDELLNAILWQISPKPLTFTAPLRSPEYDDIEVSDKCLYCDRPADSRPGYCVLHDDMGVQDD